MGRYKTVLVAVDLHGEPNQVLAKANALIDESADIHVLSILLDPTYLQAS